VRGGLIMVMLDMELVDYLIFSLF